MDKKNNKSSQPEMVVKVENEKMERRFLRFDILQRIEHWTFMLSFSILGLTGLVQRYANNIFSQSIVDFLGGVETVRIIHRVSATVMMIVTVYHIGAVAYRIYVKRLPMTMLPSIDDLRKAIQSLTYNLGFRKETVQQGRYTFEEKAEYWAVVWGTIVMGLTGFMMWNPIITTSVLPGEWIPAAKAAHGLEAVLAVLAIFLWHLYHVLVKTFNRSMFTGYVTEHQMVDEHPLELADIKAGTAKPPTDPAVVAKRKRIFWPSYGVFAVLGALFIIWFVTYEQTAIATVPPAESAQIFAPLTPTPLPTPLPTPTPLPITAVTWNEGIGDLFSAQCGTCHVNQALGGFDLSTYESALAGGINGPGIIPNDPDNSQVIIVQSSGGHPGQLSAQDLVLITEWINAGAPQE